jgi:hypothetical protein
MCGCLAVSSADARSPDARRDDYFVACVVAQPLPAVPVDDPPVRPT